MSNIDKLINKIQHSGKKDLANNLYFDISISIGIISFLIIIISLIENFANGDKSFRTFLFYSSIISVFTLFAIQLIRNYFNYNKIKKSDFLSYYSLKIGNYYTDIKDKLLNSLQLVKSVNNGYSNELAMAEFNNTYEKSFNLDFNVIIDKKKTKKSLLFFFTSIGITSLIFLVFSNSLGFAFYRILNYDKSFLPPPPYKLIIENEEFFVLRGEQVNIIIKTEGKAPEIIDLVLKESNQSTEEIIKIKLDTNKTYNYRIQSIKNSLIVYGKSKWLTEEFNTEEIKINVIEKPLIKTITGTLNYPNYTGLASKKFDEQSADLTGLKGSRADFNIMTNKALKNARIAFLNSSMTNDTNKTTTDTTFYNLKVDGNKISGGFNLNSNGTYFIEITDLDGIKNTDPVKYSCVVTNDGFPQIELLSPAMDVQLSDQALLPVELNINDDYGFSKLKLYYRLIDSKFATPEEKYNVTEIPLNSKDIYQEISYLWDLNKLNISPADKYEFYFEVSDNDIITGPKTAKTKSLLLRLPSLDEVLNNADEEQKNIENELKNVLKQADEIKKDVDEVNKELLKKNKKELDWKEKKKLDDAVKKQEAVNKKMQDLQKNLNELTDKLQENKALSPETMQKYQELQKMMKELDSPELKKLQEKMSQMMKQVSPEQMQKMMKDYKFDEEQFKKSIERTMKLLKRMQAEQKVDALMKRADELEKKLDELNKNMENSNPNDKNKLAEMQKQQKNMLEDLKNIQKEMKELEKLMQDIGKDMPMDEFKKAEQELNADQMKQEMQDAQKSTEKGDMNSAKKNQKSAQKKMQNFKNSLSQMKQKMQQNQAKEEIRKMQKAVNDMLSLSEKQEDLKEKTSSLDYNSTKFPELAEEQANLNQAMINAANNLMDLSEKSTSVTPEMAKDLGNAMKQMQNSLQSMSDRNPSASSQSQGQAMASMNEAIKSMQQAVTEMKNKQSSGSCDNPGGSGQKPSSGMGMQEQMQQLANQQQGINQAMQQMMQGNSGQMSQEMRSQMGKLQNQQGQAQKGLEEIMKDSKKNTDGSKLPFGDLEKLNKDMQEVMTDMKNNHITPETMKRQEKILSRLLDYSRALTERDYEKNRESKTGREFRRNSPGALDFDKLSGKENRYQDLIKSLNAQYTKDYEELIRKYLEKVQKEN